MASPWTPASSAADILTFSFLPPARARVGTVFPAKLRVGRPFKYKPGEQGPHSVVQREKGARYGKVFSNRACLQEDDCLVEESLHIYKYIQCDLSL